MLVFVLSSALVSVVGGGAGGCGGVVVESAGVGADCSGICVSALIGCCVNA